MIDQVTGCEEIELDDATMALLKGDFERSRESAQRVLKTMQGMRRNTKVTSVGEMRMQIPAWYKMRIVTNPKLGWAAWHNDNFIRELVRDNPELKVFAKSDKIMVGAGTHACASQGCMPVVEIDRPGRYRKSYGVVKWGGVK